MKNLKKSLSVMLVLSIIAGLFAMCGVTGAAADIIVSGACGAEGDNVIGTLYSDGLLVISGNGDMNNSWADDEFPWSNYRKDISALSIEYGINSISNWAFYDTNITEVVFPDSVTAIGSLAFSNCSGLTEITIPDSVITIGNNAFSGCTGLTSVTIGNSVESMGQWAFNNCSSLKNISIPESIDYIAAGVFNCAGLEKIVINNPKCVIEYNASTIPVDAVIYGHVNSPAQMYAQMYGRDFVPLAAVECKHSYGEWIIDADATCTQRGFSHRVCTLCNVIEFEVIDETGHIDDDSNEICDICDETLSVQNGDSDADSGETTENGLTAFLNSITEFFNKIIAWFKSIFGMA